MARVLLIDDDAKLAELLIEYAQRFALQIIAIQNPLEALQILRNERFEAVILDVMLPHVDGFETCRRIRAFSQVPIVMLTARGDVTDRIVGLELGADDYLPKPFDPRELMARVQANIKRNSARMDTTRLRFEHLQIDLDTQEVRVDGALVSLTTKEYDLLLLLASQPGTTLSRDDILATLRGTDNELFSRSVDILVSRLRQKLKPGTPIKTVHGAGYAFVARRLSTDSGNRPGDHPD